MNNYIFSQDPLLFRQPIQQPLDDERIKIQLEQAIQQYQSLQQPPQQAPRDVLGELDAMTKNLDQAIIDNLTNDVEYNDINNYIQLLIQEELMKSVRWKINSNPEAVKKIERLKQIIQGMSKEKETEDKKTMAELNEYLKHYSNLTFDEYKKMKAGAS